jgi:transketolase
MEIDGNDMEQIVDAIEHPAGVRVPITPTMLVCNTIKGKSVSFMERQIDLAFWVRSVKKTMETALAEIAGAWAEERGGPSCN